MIRENKKKFRFSQLFVKLRQWEQMLLHRLVEAKLIHKISDEQYRKKVISIYAGHRGALLVNSNGFSGHFRNGERLFRSRQFDLQGVKNILDIGSGSGPILSHLINYSDAATKITGIDISSVMIARARKRLESKRPRFVLGDLAQLPFSDQSFDCVTCCYALEHVPDARRGIEEISRVLIPGGRVLLFVTEDTFVGAWTSRIWQCQTHNRKSLINLCKTVGFDLKHEFWFTRLHRLLRVGGICVELVKRPANLTSMSDSSGEGVRVAETRPEISMPHLEIEALHGQPVEGETSASNRTRSIVSSS